MKKSLFFLIFIAFQPLFSQEDSVVAARIRNAKARAAKNIPLDSIKNSYGARYVDYKMITYNQDTIQIDTTLTIQKHFRHNFTHQDDFEWLAFANQGQTFNKLGYHFVNNQIIPKIGVTAKQYNFYHVKNINYYHVPTPTTVLKYRSGFDGQFLNSLFTSNLGKCHNFSINYKGLRSQGDYQRTRTSHTSFIFTYSYHNPLKRYQFKTNIISQKLSNFENGGLTGKSLTEFKNDNPDFRVRNRVDVNLYDAESILKSTQYYYEHELKIVNSKDSLQQRLTNLKLGHAIRFKKNNYQFTSEDVDYFDENILIYGTRVNDATSDNTGFNTMENQVYLKFNSPWVLGNFKVFGNVSQIKQSYGNSKTIGSVTIPKQKTTNYTSAGAHWNGRLKNIFLNAYGQQIINGGNLGSNLHINTGFGLGNKTLVKAGFQLKSNAPNGNTTFYQSNFSNFNWNHSFKNEIYRTLYGNIKTQWIDVDIYAHQIKNYTYFNSSSIAKQYSQTLDYLKLKLSNEIKFKKFTLNNSVLYQKTVQGSEVFRVPELVTRNTLYYTSYFFKGNPLLAQIGITFKYFTKYFANDFNPVLNEFYLQNNTKIGDYPTFDVFINGEIRRTRIYFKIENATATLTGRKYFTTSNQPGRDLSIRLGIVWNFWN